MKRLKKFSKLIATFMAIAMCMLLVDAPVVVRAEDISVEAAEEEFEEDVMVVAKARNGSYVTFDRTQIEGKNFVTGSEVTFTFNVYSSGEDDGKYFNVYLNDDPNINITLFGEVECEHGATRYFKSYESTYTETFTWTIGSDEAGVWYMYFTNSSSDEINDITTNDLIEFNVIDPVIKGKCQMPYTGPGGGYLIGVETYEDNNYLYEMLILDCTLLRDGKDAWVYTTGKCKVPENCLWTIWQPQYGYYWTLFRVYDSSGVLLEEQCYGFVNAY